MTEYTPKDFLMTFDLFGVIVFVDAETSDVLGFVEFDSEEYDDEIRAIENTHWFNKGKVEPLSTYYSRDNDETSFVIGVS